MERKRHIIFTVTNNLVTDQRMHRICSTLIKDGFEVELVGRKYGLKQEPTAVAYQRKWLSCFFDSGPLFYLEFNLRLCWYLLFKRVDVICAIDADTLAACTLIAGVRNKKLVFDAHEYFTEVPELENKPIVKKTWRFVLRICVPHVDAAYTVGPMLAELFTQQFGKKFEVIYNMPQLLALKKRLPVKQPIVLYQGDLNIGRGIEETIEAVADMELTYWIIGDGPIYGKLKQQIETKGLSGKVKLLGKVLPQDLPAYTEQAMIGINLLSGNSLSYRYSIANKFFDYVQAGVPVICVNFPEYQRLNKAYEVGVLCETNPESIKQAIHQLLHHSTLYQKISDNCTHAAKVWNWQTQESTLVNIYRNLV